jgi:acetyltransferase-like isoleucine patch superfamily enzyme
MKQTFSDPPIMKVRQSVIQRCRALDPPWKRVLRRGLARSVAFFFAPREIGEGFQFGVPLHLSRGVADIGRYVYLGRRFACASEVEIGDCVMISTDVKIVGDDHEFGVANTPIRLAFAPPQPLTVIEADAWIGKGAIIKTGVRIGRGAVVAAGAIVTRDVVPHTVVAGVPARFLRNVFSDPATQAGHDATIFEGFES